MTKKIIIYADGGARGNPGPAACAVVLYDEQKNKLGQASKFLGATTNNQAEYQGVILGLAEANKLNAEEIVFYLDSLLITNQLKQNYKIKEPGLQKLFLAAWQASQKFKKVSYHHVRREDNQAADALVNLCLDANT